MHLSTGLKKGLLGLFVLLLLAAGGFLVWALTPLGPMDEALSALRGDAQVTVQQGEYLVFQPAGVQPETGLLLYPGGRVDYRSYTPAARQIAAAGYLVVLLRAPLNLAVFAPDQAAKAMVAFPSVKRWAVGGHSLGGAMAARFAFSHPGQAQGLVLWASYPASTDDLSQSGLKVVSILGTNDGQAGSENFANSRLLLPADTTWVSIDGGNHAGFGWYGPQPGDGQATITRDQQQSEVVAATVSLLERLAAP